MIKDILTSNALNIDIGASGTNKTIWNLQALEAAAKGEPAFGVFQPDQPLCPVWYAAFDRTEEELEAKFVNISLPKDLFRYKSYQKDLHHYYPKKYKSLIEKVFKDMPKDTGLVIIDGIGYVITDAISQTGVSSNVSFLQDLRTAAGVALKLTHHTPKAKGGDKYDDPREKGLGSGTWCQMANTAIVYEKVDPKDVNNHYRRIWVLHNDPRGDKEYGFLHKQGRLIHLPQGIPQEELMKGWTIDEVSARFGVEFHEARKIRAKIQAGLPVERGLIN